MAEKLKKIVVCGDAAIDIIEWEPTHEIHDNTCEAPHHNWQIYKGFQSSRIPGGSLLLAQMTKASCRALIISQQLDGDIDCISPNRVIHSLAILDKYPLSPEKKDSKDSVYRVKQFRGFSGPSKETPPPLKIQNDDPDADLVILDDSGNGFRDRPDVWPLSIRTANTTPIVILKMSRPLASGALWDHLSNHHAKNLVVIISANDLRECGVNISHSLSWERTAEDFMWQITNNPEIKAFANCSNIIVRFGLDGAIYYSNQSGKKNARLFYHPQSAEDSFKDQYRGEMQGITVAFVAALSAHIANAGFDGLYDGIRDGIIKSRALFIRGFGKIPERSGYPIQEVFAKDVKDTTFIADISISDLNKHRSSHRQPWTILQSLTHGQLDSVAYNIVINGTDRSLKHVPEGKFGGLRTIERSEIESYQSIKNLIIEFLNKKDQKKTLSIAVFGPPGSGKSFGVTQLAESIAPEQIKKIEFNVSQFKSIADLSNAFQKVRDLVLEGKIPLVFFDEFDCYYEQNFLGWLKYFLAPMQDGVFKDGEVMHPIGKSIFVFAGGTSSTFKQFAREVDSGEITEKEKSQFREAKGIDFISRLQGYVNIIGPNQEGDDAFFIIRRALLLRSLLEKNAPHIFDANKIARIDKGVLRAMLTIPKYKHGVRSMMAVIDMSRLKERRVFEQAALPSEKQLDLHVDGDLFVRLALHDVLFNDAIEKLAISLFGQQSTTPEKAVNPNELSQTWSDLDENTKQEFRQQAQHLHDLLLSSGFDFDFLVPCHGNGYNLSAHDIGMLDQKDSVAEKLPDLLSCAGIRIQKIQKIR